MITGRPEVQIDPESKHTEKKVVAVQDHAGGVRIVKRCDQLGVAPFSDEAGMLFRPYLGAAHAATLPVLAQWMQDAGMATRLDPAGNLIGRYEGNDPGAPAVMIGSHIDSVRDGGNYDGPLGVMLGVELVDRFARTGRRLPFAIEVIAFGDEEGSRFHTSMLCSRAVAGRLAGQSLDLKDADGRSLADRLASFTPAIPHTPLELGTFADAVRQPASLLCFIEAHIEQGPQLEAEDLALGVVTGIAGQLRYRASFTGKAGHAGTTPMALRRDALAAAAEAVLCVERIAGSHEDVVATVGRLQVFPGSVNVVAGRADFSIDIRSGDMARRDVVSRAIIEALEAIAGRRGIAFELELMQNLVSTPCDPELIALMSTALVDQGQPIRQMFSGAGHDTMVMAEIVPTVMLFLRCTGGISHHPNEHVREDDVDFALRTLVTFVERLEDREHARDHSGYRRDKM